MTFLSTSEAPKGFLESGEAKALLIRVIHVAFPHDSLPETAYEHTADSLLALAGQATRTTLAVSNGLATLGAGDFLTLGTEEATERLRAIENTEFFAFVRGNTVLTLYNLPEVWEALGYEGASFDKGGYLHRGFDDLDWLPDPRVEEYQGELSYVEIGPLAHPVGPSTETTDEVTK